MFKIMEGYITNLYQTGYLTDIDIHFAKFITGLGKNDDPDIFLAAALASHATGNGDVYFDLASMAERPVYMGLEQEGTVKWPKLSVWLQKIRQKSGSRGARRLSTLDTR
jgi:exodeoxyribonuclease V alpha subunit